MNKRFFILIGRSGSGKGTQAALLKEKMGSAGATDVLHVTTGGGFRKFMEIDSYASRQLKKFVNSGGLAPEFFAVWNWSQMFLDNVSENTSVILDGAPRKLGEVESLHSLIHFFDYKHAVVVHLNVSETWAKEKLLARGREDDKSEEEIARKMAWYEEQVLPCLDHYAHNPLYTYLHVNGEQTVDEVHAELLEKLAKSGVTI